MIESLGVVIAAAVINNLCAFCLINFLFVFCLIDSFLLYYKQLDYFSSFSFLCILGNLFVLKLIFNINKLYQNSPLPFYYQPLINFFTAPPATDSLNTELQFFAYTLFDVIDKFFFFFPNYYCDLISFSFIVCILSLNLPLCLLACLFVRLINSFIACLPS